jgi:hypothetical protein
MKRQWTAGREDMMTTALVCNPTASNATFDPRNFAPHRSEIMRAMKQSPLLIAKNW